MDDEFDVEDDEVEGVNGEDQCVPPFPPSLVSFLACPC